MKLIPEWKRAWRFLSVNLSGAFAIGCITWPTLSDEQKVSILQVLHIGPEYLAAVGFVAVIAARLIAQPGAKEPKE